MAPATSRLKPLRPLFALGAFAQIAQILVFREMMAVGRGTELVFGVVLAAGLLWTALGSFLAARAARSASENTARAFALAFFAASVLLPLQLLTIRALAADWTGGPGQVLSLTSLIGLAIAGTSLAAACGGAAFVLGLRRLSAVNFSAAYRAESLGAAAGGALFSALIGPLAAPLLMAGVVAAIGGIAACGDGCWPGKRIAAIGWAVALLASYGIVAALPVSARGFEPLERIETAYGRLEAVRTPGSAQVCLRHNGALIATFDPSTDRNEQREVADLCACLHPAPRRAILIGGAVSGLAAWLPRHGVLQVDALELDPAIFDLAARYGGIGNDPHLRWIATDGRRFVQEQVDGEYDLAIIAPGEPLSALTNRYYTREFFGQLRRVLAPGGVCVVHLTSYGAGPEYQSPDLIRRTACIWEALRANFGPVRAAPVYGHLLAAGVGTPELSFDPVQLAARLERRPGALPRLVAGGETVPISALDYLSTLGGGVLAEQTDLSGQSRHCYVEELESELSAAAASVNTDEHPVAVLCSLELEAAVVESSRHGQAGRLALQSWAPWSLAAVLLLANGIGLALLLTSIWTGRPRGRRLSRQMAAAVVGFFGLAGELMLLAAYQNLRGCVYSQVGAFIACFMLGLAGGALAAGRWGSRAWHAAVLLILIGLFCVGWLPVTTRLAQAGSGVGELSLWLSILIAGALDGAALVALAAEVTDARQMGALYACDLAGAAAGGLLAGALWIPWAGMWATSLAVAALAVFALLPRLSEISAGVAMAGRSDISEVHQDGEHDQN